jgi:hypothetical protein
VSQNASRSRAYSGSSRTPRARPTATVSRSSACSSSRARAFARIGPIGWRIAQVAPLSPTRNTNFSHVARSMSSLSATPMAAARQAAANASSRAVAGAPSSPRTSRCIVPVCRITPGRSMTAAM